MNVLWSAGRGRIWLSLLALLSACSLPTRLPGATPVQQQLNSLTANTNELMAGWQRDLAQFRALRRRYLLYPEALP